MIHFTPKKQIEPTTTKKTTGNGFIEKANEFLGTANLAKGTGIALARLTPEVRRLEYKISNGTASNADLEAYQSIIGEAPSNKEIIGSAISTASLAIPGVGKGASLGTKVAAGAGTGYAMDVGAGLQKEKSTAKAFAPSYGTAVGALLPVVGTIIGKAASKMKPEELERISLRLSPTEQKNLTKKGQNIAKYISDKKIVGSPEQRYAKIDQLYDVMEDKVQDVIKSSNKTYKKSEIINKLQSIPKKFSNDPAAYNKISRETEKIAETINRLHGNEISASTINEIKRNTYKRAYGKNNTDIINDAYKAVGDSIKDILDESISGLEKLNSEYGLIIASKTALRNAINRPQVGMLGKIVGYTTGAGVGNTILPGGIGMGIGALSGNKVADIVAGTGARSYTGIAINTVQKAINKIPTDKAGNLQMSKKALISLLEGLR